MRRGTGKIKSIADDQLADRSERGDDDLALADSPSDSAIDVYIDAHGADAVSGLLTPLLPAERIARIDAVLAARLGLAPPGGVGKAGYPTGPAAMGPGTWGRRAGPKVNRPEGNPSPPPDAAAPGLGK